ncbi:MAG: tRNA pseudouridine(54/55) synthase Pus10 [Candidatus Thermoplasmatota archaeon]|nr:tRNA pseudouridine(54/55) synthase Pus10 [Candidatus Thermoplasmatota archaeon]
MNSSNSKSDYSHEKIHRILESYHLCDHCIGRLCTHRKEEELFQQAGKRIREKHSTFSKTVESSCELCHGLFEELPDFYQIAFDSVNDYEFNTFLIGCHIDEDISTKENQVIEEFDLTNTASVKQEINEYIGIRLEEEMEKKVSFKHPDIMIIINTQFNVISLQIKPLYLFGRYNKFQRGLPQTKWFCRQCHGKGCRYCQYTGKLYENSVEEFIAKPVVNASQADDEAFHGAGREDIDVRMLGDGRPFVLEVKNPKKRSLDLASLTKQIKSESDSAIAVNYFKYTERSDIARIKEAHFQKVYVVKIHARVPIQKEKLKKVAESLQGTTINQQTPTRVEKRRAKKVRRRQIYRCNVLEVDEDRASIEIESESGTYIKELITGDDGKTQPNLSALLNVACSVDALDVKQVKGE